MVYGIHGAKQLRNIADELNAINCESFLYTQAGFNGTTLTTVVK